MACDDGKPDVLAEFPPPRLARESARQDSTTRSSGDCSATFRLHGRATRSAHEIPGSGTFQLRGGAPASGEVSFDVRRAAPSLPPRTLNALASRDPSLGWTWRLLQTDGHSNTLAEDGTARSPELSALSELELNAVRTRQNHTLVSKLTRHERDAPGVFETTLRLDLGAHHLGALRMPDESAPRRADVLIRCRVEAPDESEPTSE